MTVKASLKSVTCHLKNISSSSVSHYMITQPFSEEATTHRRKLFLVVQTNNRPCGKLMVWNNCLSSFVDCDHKGTCFFIISLCLLSSYSSLHFSHSLLSPLSLCAVELSMSRHNFRHHPKCVLNLQTYFKMKSLAHRLSAGWI